MIGVNRKGIQQSVDVCHGLSSGILHRVLHCTTKGNCWHTSNVEKWESEKGKVWWASFSFCFSRWSFGFLSLWIRFSCFVRGPFPQISMAFSITRIARESDVANYRWAAWRKLHALKWDVKTVDFFGGQKLEVCIINAPKCVRLLRNSNYFFRDVPERNNQNIIYCPTSKQIFLGTNRNIKKASHALLACHLLNDWLYLVCLEVGGNTEDGNWFSK